MFLRVFEGDPNDVWADDALQRAAKTAWDRGDAATARRLAGQFTNRFPRSPLRAEVMLIEARSAAMAGEHRGAATLLESLLKVARRCQGPERTPPLGIRSPRHARYELALPIRPGTDRRGRCDPEPPRRIGERPDRRRCPVPARAGSCRGGPIRRGRGSPGKVPGRQSSGRRRRVRPRHTSPLPSSARAGLRMPGSYWTCWSSDIPGSKALPRARLRLAEAALAADQPDRAAEQFRIVANVRPGESSGARRKNRLRMARKPRSIRPCEPGSQGAGEGVGGTGKTRGRRRGIRNGRSRSLPDDPNGPEIALARARRSSPRTRPMTRLRATRWRRRNPRTQSGCVAALARARLLVKLGKNAEAAAPSSASWPIPRGRRRLPRPVRRPMPCSPSGDGRWWTPPGRPRLTESFRGC